MQGKIHVSHISSDEQTADVLTKAISSSNFHFFAPNSKLKTVPSEFAGAVSVS